VRRLGAAIAFFALALTPAFAQDGGFGGSSSETSGSRSMGALVADGYEIKAASPTGNKFVVFLQKEGSAYACEFVTLSNSRCGEID